MPQVSGTTDTYDLVGIAEDVEDIIYNVAPTETPYFSMAGRRTADNTLHQWQTDTLATPGANRQIEGDEATFETAAPTTMLANYTQISRKTIIVSDTADRVRKYGRDRETAYLMVKRGKELKRDIETALVQNQASSAGGSGTARSSAGLESMITNWVQPTAGTTGTSTGYAGGGAWTAPTDGTATGAGSTLSETYLVRGLELVWTNGGEGSLIMTNTKQKQAIAQFQGAAKFAGNYHEGGRTSQGILVGGIDLYISDYGEHRIRLNRWMRQRTVFILTPDTCKVAWLRRIKPVSLAKTGDAEKSMIIGEFTSVLTSPEANAKIADLYVPT